MKLGTAMKCVEGHSCSLHLIIRGALYLSGNIHGIEMCSLSMDTQSTQCVNVRISGQARAKLPGRKVKVQYNCFEVREGQQVQVTMRTVPNYCGIQRSRKYHVEDCRNSDVEKNIPACFAVAIKYDVDKKNQIILVTLLNAQGTDYYVRLCHQWFACQDVGAVTLVHEKDLLKPVSLHYTQMLPCLCIEAWPAIPDARRRRLCPFKNDTEALWDNNIVYISRTKTLSWEAACPVNVTVSLCQRKETNGECVDIENTSKTVQDKVTYSVDAHPALCMKFTTHHGSWVRCPFTQGAAQVWNMRLDVIDEQIQVSFMSMTAAQFSVHVCNKSELSSCDPAGKHQSISVDGANSTFVNISGKTCGSNICIQGWRTDVDYSIPTHICDMPCNSLIQNQESYENAFSILSLAAVLVIAVIMTAILGLKLSSVFQTKGHEGKNGVTFKTQRMKMIHSSH
ncbi:putative interleukin-17 receptor E-like [Hemicordylus capensis]|uniref:putative interleukin-17 receptor E-like n=1 Tax=Hemicordylus capensis TaxID=884348 RepID=UPI002303CA96|nr:putative interleukin-17 receptor E-like [Hemicordylus capensis]